MEEEYYTYYWAEHTMSGHFAMELELNPDSLQCWSVLFQCFTWKACPVIIYTFGFIHKPDMVGFLYILMKNFHIPHLFSCLDMFPVFSQIVNWNVTVLPSFCYSLLCYRNRATNTMFQGSTTPEGTGAGKQHDLKQGQQRGYFEWFFNEVSCSQGI